MMFKSVVQEVLLYGRKFFVVTDTMMTVIEGFHHRIARRIGRTIVRKGGGGKWDWDLVDATLGTMRIFQ